MLVRRTIEFMRILDDLENVIDEVNSKDIGIVSYVDSDGDIFRRLSKAYGQMTDEEFIACRLGATIQGGF